MAQHSVLGINRRNLEFIYPNNSRSDFPIADDKALFKEILNEHRVPVPQTYVVIDHLWELDEKVDALKSKEHMVIKPASGSGGQGIILLQKNPLGWSTPDDKLYDLEKIKIHMADILYGAYSHDHADRVIVEEKIVPHPFFHEIYPVGIPDIRLIFHNDQPIQGMLRIPTRKSQGKANLHQGAFGIGIDLDSGVLGHGIRKNRKLDVHPDSGIRFSGMKIPDWHRFMEISSRTAELVPLKFLGIDLIMDRERGPLVIEINARPGLQIQNANGTGLLDTVRIKQGGTL